MRRARKLAGAATASLLGVAMPVTLVSSAGAAGTADHSRFCRSPSHSALAARLGRDIQIAQRGRVSAVAVRVEDPGKRLGCWFHSARHFDSASVVKVTILGALLRKAWEQHRYLTDTEVATATAMITRSDNDAASALWAEVGREHIQHFLNLAGMKQTILGPSGYWGLTRITAHDEMRLLRLLTSKNRVLDLASRNYALGLMAHVIPAQRWGVPAGAPDRLTAHVKNGWLPLPVHGWLVHSIGCFTSRHGGYNIVVLTQNNPSMTYGIRTIEAIARVIHRDLNSH